MSNFPIGSAITNNIFLATDCLPLLYAVLSGSKPAYFRIGNEVVKATAATFWTTATDGVIPPDDQEGGETMSPVVTGQAVSDTGVLTTPPGGGYADVAGCDYTIVRAQFGTSAAAHATPEHVVDITMGVDLAIALVGRFSGGVAGHGVHVDAVHRQPVVDRSAAV